MAREVNLRYEARTREQLAKRANQQGSSREGFIKDSIKTWTPTEGDHRIRIIQPSWPDADHYGIDVYAHYSIGLDGSTFVCLDNPPVGYEKQRCPICDERKAAQEAGELDLAEAYKPNKRVCVFMIDRDKEVDGPMIWPMPYTLDKDIANLVIDPEGEGVYLIDHPEKGFDIHFKRTGKGTRTRYEGLRIARNESYLAKDQRTQDEWLDYVFDNPLPKCILMADPRHIRDVVEAGGVRTDSSDRGRGRDRDDDRGRSRDDDRSRGRHSDDDGRSSGRGGDGDRPSRGFRSSSQGDNGGRDRGRDDRRESARAPHRPVNYQELSEMSEDAQIELARAENIRLNSREATLPQLADALGFYPPRRDDDRDVRPRREIDERGRDVAPREDRGRDREPSRGRERDDDWHGDREPATGRERGRGGDDRDGGRGRDDGRSEERRSGSEDRGERRDDGGRDDDRGRGREGDRINRLREGLRGRGDDDRARR